MTNQQEKRRLNLTLTYDEVDLILYLLDDAGSMDHNSLMANDSKALRQKLLIERYKR